MHPGAVVDLYCERTGPGLLAEPFNLFSNVGFFIAAWWLLGRADARPAGYRLLAWLILLIGVGSSAFHLFARVWAEWLDVLFIGVYIYSFVVLFLRLQLGWRWPLALLGIPAFWLFAQGLTALFPVGALNGSVTYLPALLALLLMSATLALRRRPGAGLLALAALVFSVSLVLRSEDLAWCAALPSGTHWLWHLLNALTLAAATESLPRVDRDAADARLSRAAGR